MADLDSALRQRAHELSLLSAREETARQEAIAASLAQEAHRLEKLAASEDLLWFTETYLRPLVEAEQKAALDLTRSAAERDNSAHRYDVARTFLQLLPTKAAALRTAAVAATQKRTTPPPS